MKLTLLTWFRPQENLQLEEVRSFPRFCMVFMMVLKRKTRSIMNHALARMNVSAQCGGTYLYFDIRQECYLVLYRDDTSKLDPCWNTVLGTPIARTRVIGINNLDASAFSVAHRRIWRALCSDHQGHETRLDYTIIISPSRLLSNFVNEIHIYLPYMLLRCFHRHPWSLKSDTGTMLHLSVVQTLSAALPGESSLPLSFCCCCCRYYYCVDRRFARRKNVRVE